MTFRTPTRAIFSLDDLTAFSHSETKSSIVSFISTLCFEIHGKPLSSQCTVSEPAKLLLDVLDHLELKIADFPPAQSSGARFGNKSFRLWLDDLRSEAMGLIQNMLSSAGVNEGATKELAPYLIDSFGNSTRLDYGTGHEATFIMFLRCLSLCDFFCHPRDTLSVVLRIIPRYLTLVRALIATYSLEPAGTHGAWSLDDYTFLPFLLGAAQLQGHSIPPRQLLNPSVLAQHSDDFLFIGTLRHIREKKSSVPFAQGSPMLFDIVHLPSWDVISSGLANMFQEEVLGKFPVAQHFLFGALLPATWRQVSEDDVIPQPVSGLALLRMQQRSPMNDMDNFVRYFKQLRASRKEIAQPNPLIAEPSVATVAPFAHGRAHNLLPNNSGVEINGWTIKSTKKPLSDAVELQRMQTEDNLDFSLPEMVFGGNTLDLTWNVADISILFRTAHALQRCSLKVDVEDREILKVPVAHKWEARSRDNEVPIQILTPSYDWTFTTDYLGTLTRNGQPIELHATEHTIPYALLKQREPILWYDEVTLFDAELNDFGVSSYSMKVRVMSSCIFVLARFWMRLDGVMLRVWDTRIFHLFGAREVLFEVSRKQGTVEQVNQKLGEEKPAAFFRDPQNFVEHLEVKRQKTLSLSL
eukprot:c7763_g1_i1.p1 GENE.c7763_g1_i1~~c7763_g1_i1.p1  ORF type:complete len:649 (+),score=116.87 c7763_g1_i1:35-1948(+)